MLKKINFPWFGRRGMFIYPESLPGLLLSIAALAYIVYSFIDIDSRSHSASDTLRPFIIRIVIVYAVFLLIAFITGSFSKKNNPETD